MNTGLSITADASLVPVPGPVLGRYPQRADEPAAAARWRGLFAGLAALRWPPRPAQADVAEVRAHQAAWHKLDEGARLAALNALRARLARSGFAGALRAEALGCICATAQQVLARDPYDTQLMCAHALLDDKLVEMATGEGKTLAAALAAAVAALAGVPVHVMTANDYLAQRDAAELAPLYGALGLRTGVVLAGTPSDARRAAYACDITYCTAREVAFDHLRDRIHLHPLGSELQQRAALLAGDAAPPLLLRGLCMALLDEADSLLIDEATMPLVLAEADADPAHRARCVQALALARPLRPDEDFQLDPDSHAVQWTAAGAARLEQSAAGLGPAWLNRRHRQELVGAALLALHGLQRERHYLVRDARVELLDAVTGRAAQGRVWSRSLHGMVELKEGLALSPATRTSAQTSFQRFFGRYLRLAGISGTLAECRAELAAVYGKHVVAVPLRCPSRRVLGPHRMFADRNARAHAVTARVQELAASGRPVLVGTDSVADSQTISSMLAAAGVPHRVLDALHDADEAATVAQAGRAGAVTVATRMAGRGTDIHLGPGVAERGGLHVICCQDNPSARLDRQLIGRAARQGDPGSAETWLAFDSARWQAWGWSSWARAGRKRDRDGGLAWPPALVRACSSALQRAQQREQTRQRRRMWDQDLKWQSQLDFSRLRA